MSRHILIEPYRPAWLPSDDPSREREKLLRDARVMTLYEGTSQIQKLLIGRALTGVSAF